MIQQKFSIFEHDFNFVYLFDQDQKVSKEYGAVCTPDPFLFDSEKKLYYHGRFDDALSPNQEPTKLEMEELKFFLKAIPPLLIK